MEQRARVAFNLQREGRPREPSVIHVSALVADQPAVQLSAEVHVDECAGSPIEAGVFIERLGDAEEFVLFGHTEEAVAALSRLDELLPCLAGTLAREDLARIGFLQGISHAWAADDGAARDAFRMALIVSPELAWDVRFPPNVESLFQQSIRDALQSKTAPLEITAGVGLQAEVWIDGVLIDPSGGSWSIAEGRHLVQWQSDAGFSTRVVSVETDQPLVIHGRRDVAEALMSGHGPAPSLQQGADILHRIAAEYGVGEIYIVQLGAGDRLHRFTPGTSTWVVADEGLVARRLQVRRTRSIGRGSLIAGLSLVAVGSVVGVSGYLEARQLYDEREQIQNIGSYVEREHQYDRARGQAALGLVLGGAGVVGVAIGVPLATRRAPDAPGRTARVTACFSGSLTSLAFAMRF